MQDSLNVLNDWSSSCSLMLNVNKCVEVPFCLKTGPCYQALLTDLPNFIVNNQRIPKADHVKYLGVTLSHNLSWSLHVENVFTKVRRLSFYAFRLRKLSVPSNLILKFVITCIIPHWLYCSPVIFPGLKQKDLTLLSRSLKLLARYSGIDKNALVDFIICKHFEACDRFIDRITRDEDHCLHHDIMKAVSHPRTRSTFQLLFARTSTYRNSIVPYLARLLVNRTPIVHSLKQQLLL